MPAWFPDLYQEARAMQPFAVRRVRIRMDTPSERTAAVVLFVTEDSALRAAAARVLPDEGFDVVTASHAGHALLACLAGRHIDVLVTELSMRDMAGPRLARRIRRHYPDLPVLYLANPGTHECAGVLVRPFTRDDLVGQLETALAGTAAQVEGGR